MALDSEQVLAAAFEILDTYGLADLSMRRIGEALGVRAGALYYHWANKQSLLAAMVDRMLAEVAAPADGTWDARLGEWAQNLRGVLLAHRDSADLVATTRAMGLVAVDLTAVPASILVAAGRQPDEARRAALVLVRFVVGHVAEEQAAELSRRLGVGSAQTDAVDDASFRYGVRLVVDGIGAQRAH